MNKKIEELIDFSKKNRKPISCTLEITSKCNFKCLHCYMKNIKKETMSLKVALSFLDEFKKNGGFFLTLTGGEVLMHPNFEEIYIYARKIGLAVTIFTNGSLLNERHFVFLSKYKPKKVEITLYGSSEEKYFLATGCRNAFKKTLNNIKKLKECDINVCLKSVITNYNVNDFYLIKKIAKDLNTEFRFDFYIWPGLNGDKEILKYQCDSKKIVNILIGENPDIIKRWLKAYKSFRCEKCFGCSGGRNSFYVTNRKLMKMCLYGNYYVVNLNDKTLKKGWQELGEYISRKDLFINGICSNCKNVNICDACPAYFFAHNGTLIIQKKEYACCSIAHERAVKIYKNINCLPYFAEKLANHSLEKTNIIRTYVVGESMMPTYNDGDLIFIRKNNSISLAINDIIAYKDNLRLVVHRIIKICKDYVYTKGDNANSIAKVHKKDILGKVYNE